jgi:hypothetical protein
VVFAPAMDEIKTMAGWPRVAITMPGILMYEMGHQQADTHHGVFVVGPKGLGVAK